MSRLMRDGNAEPVSRDQILRRERGQGNIHFPCSVDHVQDCQPYPVDPYSCDMCDHTYMRRHGRPKTPGLTQYTPRIFFLLFSHHPIKAHLQICPTCFSATEFYIFVFFCSDILKLKSTVPITVLRLDLTLASDDPDKGYLRTLRKFTDLFSGYMEDCHVV